MSNMSYCRFRNTLIALEDCYENLDNDAEPLSPEERRAMDLLITLCIKIAKEYPDEADND